MHGCDFPQKLGAPRVDPGDPLDVLLSHLGKFLGALLGDLDEPLGALLLRILERPADLSQRSLYRAAFRAAALPASQCSRLAGECGGRRRLKSDSRRLPCSAGGGNFSGSPPQEMRRRPKI
jgi:hypothetical protein